MKGKILTVLAMLVVISVLAACVAPAAPAPAAPAEAPAAAEAAAPAEAAAGVVQIPVIIKATDSDFWQYVWVGAKNYELENPDKVAVTLYGPKSEADIDKQIAILEDVIAKNPACIVMASTSSDAPVAAIENAAAAGTKFVMIDNKVTTDKVNTFLATDNLKGGALAAEKMVEALTAKGVELKGKVALISAMAGVQVLVNRDQGFTEKMKELAPDVEVLETKYTDNDIVKALGIAQDLMAANPDMIGIFADNNHTGDGAARAIIEANAQDKIVGVAFDSDPEEVKAIADGVLYALILQDPFGMGYKGVDSCLKAIAGEELPAYVDTGAVAVTKDNMDAEDVKGLLDPFSKKVEGASY
jgi:ribose transport system substrate-binding protein